MDTNNPFTPLPSRAPPGRSVAVVVGCGLLTTALVLAVVQWLGARGTFVMGWYANYVFPVGALLVGLAASSGYALGSWWGGARVTGRVAGVVGVLSFAAYVLAQYGEYRFALAEFGMSPADLGFLPWFDAATRAFAWERHGDSGDPLGGWGYLLRLGELVGFVGGGLVLPLVLKAYPYCEGCARYYRSRTLGKIPAGAEKHRLIGGGNKRDWQERHEENVRTGVARAERMAQAAANGDRAAWEAEWMAARREPGGGKPDALVGRVALHLFHCPGCAAGFLRTTLVTGHGRGTRSENLFDRRLQPEMVKELRKTS